MADAFESFVELCLSGKAVMDDIDDFVSEWHSGDSPLELHEFLGMSEQEYAEWILAPDILPLIISSHLSGVPWEDLLPQEELRLAARASNPAEAAEIVRWLREHKHIQ